MPRMRALPWGNDEMSALDRATLQAMDSVRARLRVQLVEQIRAVLAPRKAWLTQTEAEIHGCRRQSERLQDGITGVEQDLQAIEKTLEFWHRPFEAHMSIDQAWRRHAGAQAVFARHHLPACHLCSVRFDETLEEAAQAYGLKLSTLLSELNGLLPSRPSTGAHGPGSRPDAVG